MVNVYSVTRINATQVELAVAAVKELATHRLTVANVKDVGGHVIDPAHDSLVFVVQDLNPQLASATVIGTTTIRCVFSEAMADAGLTTITNYVFTGPTTLTTSTVTKIDSTTVDVVPTEEMRTGGSYTITVSNVTDAGGKVIDPDNDSQTFAGAGVAPWVSSAAFVNSTTLTVTFNSAMEQTSMETSLNYVLSGASTPTVIAAVKQTDQTVQLTTNPAMIAGSYTTTVSNVTDLVGNAVDPAHKTAAFSVVAPQVSSAAIVDTTHIDVTFNADIEQTSMETPANYILSGASSPSVTAAVKQTIRIVRLTVNPAIIAGAYTVTVSSVYSTLGIVIDPAHDEGTFTNVLPRVTAGTFIDYSHFDVTFDTSMEQTTMETNTNYSVTGPSTPNIDAAVKQTVTRVRLTTNPVMVAGNYTATVINVQDIYGNVVDPAHDDATFEAGGGVWTQYAPAHSPSARAYYSMAYDTTRNVMVLFGGWNGGYLGETWEWDGTDWTQIATAHSPTGRAYSAMDFDATRNVMVLFGGSTALTRYDSQTWEYNGVDWTRIYPVASPSGRYSHGVTFYPPSNACILFGGDTGSYNQQTYSYNGATWTLLAPPVKPAWRGAFRMAYDSVRQRIVLFGGYGVGGMAPDDTYEWTGATWVQQLPAVKPSRRYYYGMSYDTGISKCVLFGGYEYARLDDTWEYNGVTPIWKNWPMSTKPSARSGVSLVYDPDRNVNLLFGGYDGAYDNETWEYAYP